MAHANVALNFNAFLEKTKLKDDGSNYTDWVRNLRIILIAAKKDYVLDAPLGEAPIPENQDVMNTCQSRADDCHGMPLLPLLPEFLRNPDFQQCSWRSHKLLRSE